MTGDQADIVRRIRAVLPVGWFSDESPLLDSLLSGMAQTWSWIYDWIASTEQETRLSSATGIWLDVIATDYFNFDFARKERETDGHLRARIRGNLLRRRGTRADIISVLTDLTGRCPDIFEPALCADTGGYGTDTAWSGKLYYNVSGGWGSLILPFECFITAYRPVTSGIAFVAGWCSAAGGYGNGVIQYANLALMEDQVSDAEIYSAISATLPTSTIGWTKIAD